jgi:hypothetical protein
LKKYFPLSQAVHEPVTSQLPQFPDWKPSLDLMQVPPRSNFQVYYGSYKIRRRLIWDAFESCSAAFVIKLSAHRKCVEHGDPQAEICHWNQEELQGEVEFPSSRNVKLMLLQTPGILNPRELLAYTLLCSY